MTGSNNPYLAIGGPKDGKLMTIDNACHQVHVRELSRYLASTAMPPWDASHPVDTYSHIYYKASFAGESFLIHETLHSASDYPRNVFARLKSSYKVFE